MKRLWLFPLLFFILLLLAFQFRWKESPLRREAEQWVVLKTDRWTGNTWSYRVHTLESTGLVLDVASQEEEVNIDEKVEQTENVELIGENLGSSETLRVETSLPLPYFLEFFSPVIDEEVFAERLTTALETEETKQKILEIEYRIEDTNQALEDNRQGHVEYEKAEENFRLKRSRRRPSTQQTEAHEAWTEANNTISQLKQELSELYKEVSTESYAYLQNQVVFKTRLFTLVWGVFTILSLLIAVHFFMCEVKHGKRINETFEVIEYHTRKDQERVI